MWCSNVLTSVHFCLQTTLFVVREVQPFSSLCVVPVFQVLVWITMSWFSDIMSRVILWLFMYKAFGPSFPRCLIKRLGAVLSASEVSSVFWYSSSFYILSVCSPRYIPMECAGISHADAKDFGSVADKLTASHSSISHCLFLFAPCLLFPTVLQLLMSYSS